MKSMTGYGKARTEKEGYEMTAEIKSVNHRFLDVSLKLPKMLSSFEDNIRKMIALKLTRGRVEVSVNLSDNGFRKEKISVNYALAADYAEAAKELSEKYGIVNDLSFSVLARSNEVITLKAQEEEEEVILEMLERTVNDALEVLCRMREFEGERLIADIAGRIDSIEDNLKKLYEIAPSVPEEYAEKLRQRINEYMGDIKPDEARVATEIALFADKSNIDEELTRLSSHVAHFRALLKEREAVGRQLDFLTQELNREVNTICSKSNNINITNIGLVLKNEIEKIREQVQNIE